MVALVERELPEVVLVVLVVLAGLRQQAPRLRLPQDQRVARLHQHKTVVLAVVAVLQDSYFRFKYDLRYRPLLR